jgi:hypothetical protein
VNEVGNKCQPALATPIFVLFRSLQPQLCAQRPFLAFQRRPRTGRGKTTEGVRQPYDAASSPRLKGPAFIGGELPSPSSTLSGVSNSLPPPPTGVGKGGLQSGLVPKTPETPMNSANKRGRRQVERRRTGYQEGIPWRSLPRGR